jgi:hypothetical protein
MNTIDTILAKVIEYCKKHVEAGNSKDKLSDHDELNKWGFQCYWHNFS